MRASTASIVLCGMLSVLGTYLHRKSPLIAGEPQTLETSDRENSEAVRRTAARMLKENDLRGITVPAISSNPRAPFTIYLDFDGHNVPAWHEHPSHQAPAFDADGDPDNFDWQEAWGAAFIAGLVGEDFAPFNVNVTTVEPERDALGKRRGIRVVIGGTGEWYRSSGIYYGISHRNDFYQEDHPIVFVSCDDIRRNENRGIWYYYLDVGNTASHEVGHALGAVHHGPSGDDREAIMLSAAGGQMRVRARRNWSSNDVTTLTSAFVSSNVPDGYRPDEADNYLGIAFPGLPPLQKQSVIEKIDDKDRHFFRAPGGRIIVTVSPLGTGATPFYGNLDAALQLCIVLEQDGEIVTAPVGVGGDPPDSLGVSVSRRIPAPGASFQGFGEATGIYYARVSSHGGEGDLGQYKINIRHESP